MYPAVPRFYQKSAHHLRQSRSSAPANHQITSAFGEFHCPLPPQTASPACPAHPIYFSTGRDRILLFHLRACHPYQSQSS